MQYTGERVFWEDLSLHLMFLNNHAVLHVIDAATHFSSAVFLEEKSGYDQSVEGIRLALLEAWCLKYFRHPSWIRTDAESVFTSPRCKDTSTQITEIIHHKDTRTADSCSAKMKEIRGLL